MSKESLLEKICSCLEVLVNGRKTDSSPNKFYTKDKKEAIFFELKKNVHFAFEIIEKYDDLKSSVKQYIAVCHKKKCKTCDYLNFLELIVVLLKLLCKALLAEENEQNDTKKATVPKGLLSISQQKIVKRAFQFVVALGVLPNLLRGIGIPLSRRSDYAKMLEHFTSDISPRQKQAQIAVCVDTLLCCMERSALQGLLCYHATDVLAALFQLCHAPIKKVDSKNPTADDNLKRDSETHASQPSLSQTSKNAENNAKVKDVQENYFGVKLSTIKDYSSFSDQQLINEMMDDRNHFTPKMEKFLKQIHPSLLLWELLLFQGIPIKSEDTEFTLSKVPLWLRKICSQMLTDMLLQNNGIESFVQVVLDKAYGVNVHHHGKVDTVRLDAVAKLIVCIMLRNIAVEDYIHRMTKQVLDLLSSKGSSIDSVFHYIASSIILHICDEDMKVAEKYFLDVLFQPLWMCVSTTGEAKIVVEEKVLSYCIEDIYKIFVENSSPLSQKHVKLLFPFFHCLCNMYFFLMEGVSTLKSKMKSLLVNILSSASDEEATSLLHAALFSIVDDQGISVYLTTVDFAYGEEVGIGAVKQAEEDITELDINCRAILGLLSELKNKNLNRSFFLLVLKVFCSYRNEVLKDPDNPKYERLRNLFSALREELPKWDIDIGEALMSNVSEVIEILVILLDTVLKWEDDDYDETMMMVLLILNTLMVGNELSSSDWAILKKCLPSLEKLMKKPISAYLKEMVFDIITRMATHGVAGDNSSFEKMHACNSKPTTSYESSKEEQNSSVSDLVTEDNICDQEHPSTVDASFTDIPVYDIPIPESSDKSSNLASALETMLKLSNPDEHSSFEEVVQHIKDPSIPVKGHGLISLGRLLSARDEETLRYKKELLPILQECLDNEDSYIYLPAIQCITLLADIDAELVLPTILKLYENPGDRNCEFVLKIGEVLLKICRSYGELIYKYKDLLLNTYLRKAEDADPRIRSSSLSNLGEACIYLKFNLHDRLQEILACVRSLLQCDEDVEVRRCAVLVITLILRGVGKEIFQILENEIRDIYSLLKIVYTTESDDVLRNHSQLALEEINTIMKELLSVQLPFTKKIHIPHH